MNNKELQPISSRYLFLNIVFNVKMIIINDLIFYSDVMLVWAQYIKNGKRIR